MTLEAVIGTWGRPPDQVAQAACVVAALFLAGAVLGRGRDLLGFHEPEASRRSFLAGAAFVAAMLSLGYVAFYLRGGPRIVDATSYFLQGRALSHGDLAWPVEGPSAAYRGRFLLFRDGEIAGIFPPGYPIVLAFGFALGAPMIVGPLLAGALVVATYALAIEIAHHAKVDLVEPVGRAAALLSIACAALRYHTADTMSHGLSALGVAAALTFALRARREKSERLALAAGLAVSVVLVTRPVSAIPIAIVVFALTRSRRTALGVVPGAVLLLLAERAVTGSWLRSAQSAYYAASDGPPGCFRYGFGRDVGCLFEHGDFVHARLPHAYGLLEALGTTLRRLKMHVLDVATFEPLALLVLVPARRARAAIAVVLLQILAYAPFYFDGNYPGGGARFFADVLPVEHALVALAVALLAPSQFARAWLAVLALSLAGFGVHAAFEHGKLRDREGGRPMFEPDVLAKANVTQGLVFVETDHGFALGHDPHAKPTLPKNVLVARRRLDAIDRFLYEALEKPPTYLYNYDVETGAANVTLWVPEPSMRFEAESEWPPLTQEGGFAAPASNRCASNGRALVLTPYADVARATIDLPVPTRGRWIVSVRTGGAARVPYARSGNGSGTVTIAGRVWHISEDAWCTDLPEQAVEMGPGDAFIVLEARGGPIALDAVTLKNAEKEPPRPPPGP